MFGLPAGSLELFSGRFVFYLVVLVDLCLATLVLITAGCGTLVGRSAAIDSLPGHGNLPRRDS